MTSVQGTNQYRTQVPQGLETAQPVNANPGTPAAGGNENLWADAAAPTASLNVDSYDASASQDAEVLQAQEAELSEKVDGLETQKEDGTTAYNDLEATIGEQDSAIEGYETSIDSLTNLNRTYATMVTSYETSLGQVETSIQSVEAQISQNSGIVGGALNFVKGIFGGGVDVSALKGQLAQLEQKKKDLEDKIDLYNGKIDDNNDEITEQRAALKLTEEQRAENVKLAASIQKQLNLISADIKSGKATLEQYKAAIKAAMEENGTEASDEAITNAALTMMENDSNENAGVPTDASSVAENVAGYLNSASQTFTDPTTGEVVKQPGEYDDTFLVDAQQDMGKSRNDAIESVVILETVVEAISIYRDLGISFDVADIESFSIRDLDAISEQAMVRTILSTTGSGRVVGNTAAFTSKKDLDDNTDAAVDFTDSYNALSGYYTANNVTDLEVNSFLSLHAGTISSLSNGTVFNTSDLKSYTAQAESLMTGVQNQVANGTDEVQSDSAFGELSYKVKGAIEGAGNGIYGDIEDSELASYEDRYETLLNQYNNGQTDSDENAAIAGMNLLYEDIMNGEDSEDHLYGRTSGSFLSITGGLAA